MFFKFLPRLVLLLVCAGGTASADVLYTTFGPGDAFNSHTLQYVGDGAAVGQSFLNRQVANRFTVASEAEVTGYRVAISHFTGSGPGDGLLSLWAGDTAPGTLLEAGILFDTGVGTAGIATVSSTFHPLLSPGNTYWLVLSATSPELYRWYFALTPSPAGSEILYRDNSDPAWNSAGTDASAFEVNGVIGGVPEPGAWLLLASTLGLTAMTRARWRAR
ncbi:MAG: hypothetical protein NTW28_16670 [Candidatus Solibacter sp.]|nr:hypothetical protein [Candidatus Solibacter sp.]